MFASAITNTIRLPKPNGRFSIGTADFHLIDHSRVEKYVKEMQVPREWMVRAWYPAGEMHNTPKRVYSDGMASIIKRRIIQFFNIPPEQLAYLDQLDQMPTHSSQNAPICSQPEKFPLLIFSHGFSASNFMYSSLLEEMASHGYIVIAIEHTYTNLATSFLDGRLVENADMSKPDRTIEQMKELLHNEVETWVKDIQFTLDQLKQNTDIGNTFKNRIDDNKIGIFGHSFGGCAAVHVCRMDSRVKAGVDMDGAVLGENKMNDIKKPFMFLLGKAFMQQSALGAETLKQFRTTNEEIQQTVDIFSSELHQLFQKSSQDGYYIVLPEADHGMFGDNFVLGNHLPEPMKGKLSPDRAIAITRQLLVDFFDHYLLGKEPRLATDLKNSSPDEVVYETKFRM